jgi:hypothetical protein
MTIKQQGKTTITTSVWRVIKGGGKKREAFSEKRGGDSE